MTDRDWAVELTAFIDGELPADEAKAVEARLAQDPALRALHARLSQTVALLKTVETAAPSAQLRRDVLARISEPTARERLAAWLAPGRLVPLSALAAAAVVAVVAVQGQSPAASGPQDEEQLLVAQHLDELEDLDVLGLEAPGDLDVVARLDELEAQP